LRIYYNKVWFSNFFKNFFYFFKWNNRISFTICKSC